MSPRTFQKLPVVIQAMLFDGSIATADAIAAWSDGRTRCNAQNAELKIGLDVHTLEGVMRADAGDWIIRGVAGEFYPCKPEIFAATYVERDVDRRIPVDPNAIPDRDPSKPSTEQGLFRKFDVRRVDGSDSVGGKHEGCEYFVLDVSHDPGAPAALTAYADAVQGTHAELASSMRERYGLLATPEGCTAEDARILREANHAIAERADALEAVVEGLTDRSLAFATAAATAVTGLRAVYDLADENDPAQLELKKAAGQAVSACRAHLPAPPVPGVPDGR